MSCFVAATGPPAAQASPPSSDLSRVEAEASALSAQALAEAHRVHRATLDYGADVARAQALAGQVATTRVFLQGARRRASRTEALLRAEAVFSYAGAGTQTVALRGTSSFIDASDRQTFVEMAVGNLNTTLGQFVWQQDEARARADELGRQLAAARATVARAAAAKAEALQQAASVESLLGQAQARLATLKANARAQALARQRALAAGPPVANGLVQAVSDQLDRVAHQDGLPVTPGPTVTVSHARTSVDLTTAVGRTSSSAPSGTTSAGAGGPATSGPGGSVKGLLDQGGTTGTGRTTTSDATSAAPGKLGPKGAPASTAGVVTTSRPSTTRANATRATTTTLPPTTLPPTTLPPTTLPPTTLPPTTLPPTTTTLPPTTTTTSTTTTDPPTTTAPTTTTTAVPTTTLPAVASPAAHPAPLGGVWLELRQCESGDNYQEDTGNGYYGAYQFSEATWNGLGYSGRPDLEPYWVQDEAAQRLQASAGWGSWPACSAALGL